jgi:hypothetical protein
MLIKIAAVSPPRSLPKSIQFFRLCGPPHKRKNWLFTGSEAGGKTMAILFSLVSSCQRHGHDPYAYLRDVQTRLPDLPRERLPELLPDRWRPAAEADARSSTGSPAVAEHVH